MGEECLFVEGSSIEVSLEIREYPCSQGLRCGRVLPVSMD